MVPGNTVTSIRTRTTDPAVGAPARDMTDQKVCQARWFGLMLAMPLLMVSEVTPDPACVNAPTGPNTFSFGVE